LAVLFAGFILNKTGKKNSQQAIELLNIS